MTAIDQPSKTKAINRFHNSKVVQAATALRIIMLIATANAQIGGMSGTVNTNAVQALSLTAQRADYTYTEENHSRAFKLYQKLANSCLPCSCLCPHSQ